MSGERRFTEDIPRLAAEASELAGRLCGPCQNYHFLWPYLRLIGGPGGAEDGKAFLASIIADALAGGRRRLLIAGAADTGLLALVARAAIGQAVDVTVLDRCATPLELCRRFAARQSFAIETLHLDLVNLAAKARFDIVFAHTILTFVHPDQRLEFLTRLRRSLCSDGRLIIRFRTKGRVEDSHLQGYRDSVTINLIKRLHGLQIALPEPRERIAQRVEAYAAERHAREATESTYSDIVEMIATAGFAIEMITPVGSDHSSSFSTSTAEVSSRLFVAVAVPK